MVYAAECYASLSGGFKPLCACGAHDNLKDARACIPYRKPPTHATTVSRAHRASIGPSVPAHFASSFPTSPHRH